MPPPVLRHWGPGRFTFACIGVVIVGVIIAAIVVEPTIAVAILPLLFMVLTAMVNDVRITEDELLLGYPISTNRIPRSEVNFARFEYRPLGICLEIHLHDGRVVRVMQGPKMTSTELSGDPPRPDSMAFQITEWARA